MPLRRLLAAALLAVALAAPAGAQYRGAGDVRFSPLKPEATSLAVGPLALATGFGYDGLARPGVPARERSGVGAQVAVRGGRLTAGYAGADGAGGASAVAALEVGPALRAFQTGDSVYVGVRVPVRLGVGYEYLEGAGDPFHLGTLGLGVGLGLEAGALVEGGPFSEVLGRVSLALRPGVLTDLSEGAFETTFGQRTAVFDVDVRVFRIGGGPVGLMVGYTRQDTRRSPTPLGDGASITDALAASGYVDQSQFGLLRFGITL